MTIKQSNTPLLIGAGFGFALIYLLSSDKKKPSGTSKPSLSSTAFVKKYYPYALAASKLNKTPPSVAITFAAIESGWGKHAPAYNFFGIKAGSKWKGQVTKLRTPECFNTGTKKLKAEILQVIPPCKSGAFKACCKRGEFTYWINDKFRAYSSPAVSFLDFGVFLKENKNFSPAFQYSDPAKFGGYVLTHGYATAKYLPTFLALHSQIERMIAKL